MFKLAWCHEGVDELIAQFQNQKVVIEPQDVADWLNEH